LKALYLQNFSLLRWILNRNEIIKAIAKLFKEKGYHNTSISDISQKVGLKGGSLYYHIKSKEDALFKICADAMNAYLAKLEKIIETDDDPKTKLKNIVESHVDYFANNFSKAVVSLMEFKALGGDYRKREKEKRSSIELHIRDVLIEGIDKGVFRKGDVKLMSFGILGMLNWIAVWYNPEGKWGPSKLKKEFVKMILSGIEK